MIDAREGTVLSEAAVLGGITLRALADLHEEFQNWLDLSDLTMGNEEKAHWLRATDALVGDLTAFRSGLAAALYASMETDLLTVDGLPPIIRSSGGRRKKWKGGKLSELVTNHALAEMADDVPPMAEVAEHIRAELVKCGGLDNASHAWRATELKLRSIPVLSDYEEGDNPTVRFVE